MKIYWFVMDKLMKIWERTFACERLKDVTRYLKRVVYSVSTISNFQLCLISDHAFFSSFLFWLVTVDVTNNKFHIHFRHLLIVCIFRPHNIFRHDRHHLNKRWSLFWGFFFIKTRLNNYGINFIFHFIIQVISLSALEGHFLHRKTV